MPHLKTIKDQDLGLNNPEPAVWRDRQTGRAILFDENQDIALLYVGKHGYHKLPGGGVDLGESLDQGLRREIIEEVGCQISHAQEFATVEEFRAKQSLHQISHCFTARVSGPKNSPSFMDDEIADGFEVVWMSLPDAIKALESETGKIEQYQGKFVNVRELAFLREAKKFLK